MGSLRRSGVLALVPARNERDRVGATVEAIRTLPSVDRVVVVDDASTDGTAEEAREAGATVLVPPARLGKGGALEGALTRLPEFRLYLFLDADLGATAKEAGALLEPVERGEADLCIGVLPRDPRHGGFRLVKRSAGELIRRVGGFRAEEPLSGQRALTREVVEAVRPLAPGFGVEVAMTIDAARLGFRILEVPVEMRHAATGRNLSGFLHRARQGRDAVLAALPRWFELR
jgi:glycosyltransferase involved in cell wall biosynthesis